MAQMVFLTALGLVSALALALVYGLGGWMAVRGSLEPGTVVTLALLLTRLYAPLTALASARVDAMTALVSFERVFEVLDLEPLIVERPDAVRVPDGPVAVELDAVVFGYPAADKVSLASLEEVAILDGRGGTEVLHEVSFRVEPGQLVALVGSSGGGKSTIATLVPRLYDVDRGSVRLSGIDVRDLTFDSVRETVGMVTQDGHLFHNSVRGNLTFVRPEASDEELWDVLAQARLGDLVRSLPDGLDTVIGERGYRLSGGERQRLTIARLLLARPRVVILDEATAHLDSTSEAAVQAALVDALAGRTAIVIAHRLSTIREAEAIVVIEEGRVLEQGTHLQLLAAGGRYAELYRTQFQDDTAPAPDPAAGREVSARPLGLTGYRSATWWCQPGRVRTMLPPFFWPAGTGTEPPGAPPADLQVLGHDGITYLVVLADGSVAAIDPTSALATRFVNSSSYQFVAGLDALAECRAELERAGGDALRAVGALRHDLNRINIAALGDRSNWWAVLLDQLEGELP